MQQIDTNWEPRPIMANFPTTHALRTWVEAMQWKGYPRFNIAEQNAICPVCRAYVTEVWVLPASYEWMLTCGHLLDDLQMQTFLEVQAYRDDQSLRHRDSEARSEEQSNRSVGS